MAVLAACGQAPHRPNRPSLSWPCEYLKHWVPTCFGPPPSISACAGTEAKRAANAIAAAAEIVNPRIVRLPQFVEPTMGCINFTYTYYLNKIRISTEK
jgi:hypothetical protein